MMSETYQHVDKYMSSFLGVWVDNKVFQSPTSKSPNQRFITSLNSVLNCTKTIYHCLHDSNITLATKNNFIFWQFSNLTVENWTWTYTSLLGWNSSTFTSVSAIHFFISFDPKGSSGAGSEKTCFFYQEKQNMVFLVCVWVFFVWVLNLVYHFLGVLFIFYY